MTRILARHVAVLMALIAAAASLEAKGATAKLAIAGPSLRQPVEVVEPRLLAESNVFAGGFIGPTIPPPAAGLARYTVSFYVQAPDWMKESARVAYVVHYATDASSGEGFIYLPGRGEPGYATNVGTIERVGDDGKWHRAPKAWTAALNRYIR